jgi:hypothetical protein
MRTYIITVKFSHGKIKRHQATAKKLQRAKNVLNYIFAKYDKAEIKEIRTRAIGEKHSTLNYNLFFERAKENHLRVSAINAPGYEDLTSYGGRTEGRENRFYIGRSTGWIPCYLEILTNRSTGGGQLFEHGRKFSFV